MSGYSHARYAQSLADFGRPRAMPNAKGWLLVRQIPGFPDHDAMGCYPRFACQHWPELAHDLDDLGDELVSLALVTDPFGEYDLPYLQRCFKDVVRPFKQHYVVDLRQSMHSYVSRHHQRNARKALQTVQVERCQNPIQYVDEWHSIYQVLVERHGIKGIPAFSRAAFVEQLQVPGIVIFRATHNGIPIGMTLWYVSDEVGYSHLAAYNDAGYERNASYALFWCAIEYFSDNGLQWLDLGAGSGLESDENDGLSRFKQGWATGTRPAYLCGRIYKPARYAEIARAKNNAPTTYFPAYRAGEFA